MKTILIIMGLTIMAGSCSKSNPGGPAIDTAVDSLLNLKYGDDPKQAMDLYLPRQRNASTKTVVIIHGGGWTGGDKAAYTPYIHEFRRRLPGYAFANLNYRLVTQTGNYFPTQEHDVGSAMTFLRDNAENHSTSKDFILIGISAGAHLSLLQTYKHSDIVQPKGVVSYFGPTDLVRLYVQSDVTIPDAIKKIRDSVLAGQSNILYESSPLNYVTPSSSPTLLLHGDSDKTVPVEQAALLRDTLVAKGVRNELHVYPGMGHDNWNEAALFDSFDKVEAFIKSL